MGTSIVQQLEGFTYWRNLLKNAQSEGLFWAQSGAQEERVMQQAAEYALEGQEVDFYAELPLKGKSGLDLSAQYFATSFVLNNPLERRPVARQGDLFHSYASRLYALRPDLVNKCNLYLEADTSTNKESSAAFINLSGDYVEDLLPQLLEEQGRPEQYKYVQELLVKTKEYCFPWHFGFMDSRKGRPFRLVLGLSKQLKNIPKVLELVKAPALQEKDLQLLEALEQLQLFAFTLDLDLLEDGKVGPTVGLELNFAEAMTCIDQAQIIQTKAFGQFLELLEKYGVADKRIADLGKTVFTKVLRDDTFLYSRVSHFKLGWQQGKAKAAKIYLQMRVTTKQNTINDSL